MSITNSIGLNGSLLMGSQSLNTQRQAIETIGNNISNINTPGYARQRANIVTNQQTGQGGELAMGASVSGIESLRSPLLDSLVQQSLGDQSFADSASSLTSTVQDSLGEQFTSASGSSSSGTVLSGNGPVQDALTSFFGAMQNLASSPTDATAQQVVVTDAQTLSSAINNAYTRVQNTQSQIASDANTVTTQVNQLAKSIASLNQQITIVEASSGTTANSLRDTRQADIESLSGLVNIKATPQSDGTVSVALADNPSVLLVSGINGAGAGSTQSLSVTYNANASTPLTVSASTSGALGTGVPSSGSLGAYLDVANNVIGSPAASGNTGILGALDGVANQIRTQINTQNSLGFTTGGAAGGAIFTGTGAADLAVASNVANNPALIAAGNGSGPLDGSNALAMSQIQNSSGVVPAFQNLVANLGQTVHTAASNQTTQDAVTQQLKNQRDSVSGVSIDEEMTNLINFQQAYDASARFISTISSMYNTLITGTGA